MSREGKWSTWNMQPVCDLERCLDVTEACEKAFRELAAVREGVIEGWIHGWSVAHRCRQRRIVRKQVKVRERVAKAQSGRVDGAIAAGVQYGRDDIGLH